LPKRPDPQSGSEPAGEKAPRPHRTSPADLDRLQFACGRTRIDLTQSLFGPDSITWRVNREAVLLLGGGRALLLQVAHPLVAAGVAAHSEFQRDPLGRLWRTLDLMLTITFADAARAIHAVREIERVHRRVHGKLDAAVGPFPRGARYDANDPTLLFWVHATLVETALLVYERFVDRLPAQLRRTYYEESKIGARLFGIPEELIPRRLRDFEAYMQEMVSGETLAVGRAGRDIAAAILRPPLPPGVQQLFQLTNFFTVGLLPPPVRERYGFSWSDARQTGLGGVATATRHLLPLLPGLIRSLPHARRHPLA